VASGVLLSFLGPSIGDEFAENFEANAKLADERWIAWYGALRAGPFDSNCYSDHLSLDNCQFGSDDDDDDDLGVGGVSEGEATSSL